MTQFTCMCLNVSIDARQLTNDIKFNIKEDLKSSINCDFFAQRLASLIQPLVSVEHTYLVHKKQVGDWLIHRCLNCGINTHASSIRSKDVHVLLSQQLLNDPAMVMRLKDSSDYSRVFGIVMHGQDSTVTSQSIPDPSSPSYESLQSVLNGIQEQLNNFLLQEEEAMEERIRQFEEQQRSQLQQIQSQVRSEKKKMINTLLTAERDIHSVTSNTNPSSGGIGSSQRYSPRSPVESNSGIDVPSMSKKPPLSRTRSTPVRKSQSPEPYHQAPDSEAMFMLDEVEDGSEEPFYLSDEDDDTNSDEVVPTRSIPRKRTPLRYSSSVPIVVPAWENSMQRDDLGDTEEELTPPDPDKMAESMQALARSITNDERMIFGDRPRPRLNTGDWKN